MDTRSQHLIFDALCSRPLTNEDVEHIKSVIEKNLTVVQKVEYKFTPHGETIVFILSESHFTLHTYPENNYISLDIYICNQETDLQKIVDEISSKIDFKKTVQKTFKRGDIGVGETSRDLKLIYMVSIVTAICSILYELLLAQSLSTTMGNTALRFNTTIGLYIASMGFGALMYKRIVRDEVFKGFVGIELSISVIGAMAPVLVLFFDFMFNLIANNTGVSFFSNLIQIPLFTLNHLLIVAIGFLSGLELPLLISMGKKIDQTKGNYVLAFDYVGTLLGAILFPLVILPFFHIFTIGYIVSFLNILVAMFVAYKMQIRFAWLKYLATVMIIAWALLIFYSTPINNFLIKIFYFNGNV